ncbi:Hpt domain-containing protein [Labilibacter marinus]|uniref:Hpt domain-containing protein n=1 Tax=Labilibacter marinus TaxID=1477105 RepID=UPI0008309446|nr:Hpt domain-containing protein [Labilibacter marinus]
MINKIKEGFINDTLNDLNSIELDLGVDRLGDASDCIVEKVFTAVHKIKGTAPMLGINGMDKIAFSIERVYGAIRQGDLSFSNEILSNTIKLIPVLKSELGISQQFEFDSEDVSKSLRFFDSLISLNQAHD